MIEKWLQVVGYEGLYEVSSYGRVRSIARQGTYGRILSLSFDRYKYLKVCLHNEDGGKVRLVHQLVVEAFVGPRPEGKEIDHKDKDKTNNFVSNLRYLTHKGNIQRQLNAKLTRREIIEIRRLDKEGFSQSSLASQFGVSRQHVNFIINNKRWENV